MLACWCRCMSFAFHLTIWLKKRFSFLRVEWQRKFTQPIDITLYNNRFLRFGKIFYPDDICERPCQTSNRLGRDMRQLTKYQYHICNDKVLHIAAKKYCSGTFCCVMHISTPMSEANTHDVSSHNVHTRTCLNPECFWYDEARFILCQLDHGANCNYQSISTTLSTIQCKNKA